MRVPMRRMIYLWSMVVMLVTGGVIMFHSDDNQSAGTIMTVEEQRVPVENEDLPTSPDSSQFPIPMYLNTGDEVMLLYDPGYEYSVDGQGRLIRTRTPFRKVEVEILSGSHKGSIGFVPRNSLSRKHENRFYGQ